MRQKLYFILVLAIASCYSFKTFGQINADSLEKKILESVQHGKIADWFFDTSKLLLNKLPGNLDKIL